MSVGDGTFFGKGITMQAVMPVHPQAGDVFYDTTSGDMKIYTGAAWAPVSSAVHNHSINQWGQFSNELPEDDLLAKHPGLAELKKELDEAAEKFTAYKALVKEFR